MKAVCEMTLPKGVSSYDGDVLITLPYRFDISKFPTKLKKSEGRGDAVGKVEFRNGMGCTELDITYFNEPVKQGRLNNSISIYSDNGKEDLNKDFIPDENLTSILISLGILNSHNKPTGEFRRHEALQILRYFKENFKYSSSDDRTFGDFIESKKGDCKDFSESFAQMVYLAGGVSRTAESYVICKRKLWGKSVASVSTKEQDTHRFVLVSFDNKTWEIVDPTIYVTSPPGIESRAIGMSPYVFFQDQLVAAELVECLTNDLTTKGKLISSRINEESPEKTIENYLGKFCEVSVSFPEEPIDAPPSTAQ